MATKTWVSIIRQDTGGFVRPATEREVAQAIVSKLDTIEVDGETCEFAGQMEMLCDDCHDPLTFDEVEANLLENDEQDGNGYICGECR